MSAAVPLAPSTLLETVRVFTPLGVRFWDMALNMPVTDGLAVKAYWNQGEAPPVTARRTRSGVYAFHDLPGLRAIEHPAVPPSSLPSLPAKQNFLITVEDLQGRFLPTVFGVDLPLDYRGVFLSGALSSPPEPEGRAFLFSAPSRIMPSRMAVIRADCWDAEASRPAAYAVLRVVSGTDVWVGIANERGSAMVAFPYPLLERLRLGSPPGAGQGPVEETKWPVTVTVRYQPSRLRYPLAERPEPGEPWSRLPSLKSVLEEQQPAPILLRDRNPTLQANELNAELAFRQPLILKTQIDDPQQDRSRLLISWGTSPP